MLKLFPYEVIQSTYFDYSVLSVIFQILTSLKSLQLLNLSYFQNDFSDTEQKYYANFLVANWMAEIWGTSPPSPSTVLLDQLDQQRTDQRQDQ